MNHYTLKKIVGKGLRYSGAHDLLLLLSSFSRKKRITILMYHRIGYPKKTSLDSRVFTATPSQFEEQMKFLAKNCNVISFKDLMEKKKLPQNSVLITFDDGYADNFSVAYPILKKYELPALISLASGHIGNDELFWWDKVAYIIKNTKEKRISVHELGQVSLRDKENAIQTIVERLKRINNGKKLIILKQLAKRAKVTIPKLSHIFLSWEDVRSMSSNKITFGAHTVTHPILTQMTFSEAQAEILESKKTIERHTQKPVFVFTYPNGQKQDISKDLDEWMSRQGFFCALSTRYGSNTKLAFNLKRVPIEIDDPIEMFVIKVTGLGEFFAPIYARFFG